MLLKLNDAYICMQMNSSRTRYRWMALLMISSQVLLAGFVSYWLIGQYHEEQSRLRLDLNHAYELVHDQMVDSMLMKKLIIPSLEDTSMSRIRFSENSPSGELADSGGTVVMMKQFFAQPSSEDDLISIHVEGISMADSFTNNPLANAGMIMSSAMVDEDRMVQSIKLFINENEQAFRGDSGMHVYAMQIDSAALMHEMQGLQEEKEWRFKLVWPEEDFNHMAAGEIPGIVLTGGSARLMPLMQARQFEGFLLLAILPQILFSLILLVLSASALLFAYRSLKKQIALHELRDDFIANISHELKTPVSTVKVALEALRKYDLQKDPKISKDYLEISASELDRLEQLVGKVLQHDVLRNPSLELQKENCDLQELVQKVLLSLETAIGETSAKITVLKNDKVASVDVDPVYMEGVILNLLDNALKYAGQGVEIEVLINNTSSEVSLSVSDNGPGIPKAYRKQVFDKFFRVPSGNRHNVKGYGLGLNFASQVMAAHKGSISMKQNTSGGSIFTLHFPTQSE